MAVITFGGDARSVAMQRASQISMNSAAYTDDATVSWAGKFGTTPTTVQFPNGPAVTIPAFTTKATALVTKCMALLSKPPTPTRDPFAPAR